MTDDVPSLLLYSSPRACSTACHLALAESGLPYEVRVVRIRKGEHRLDDYLAVNPSGKLPALDVGGEILTETHAILSLVADLSGAFDGVDALGRARVHEWLNFLASTVHIGFRPLTRPVSFFDDEALYPALREAGIPRLQAVVGEVERRLQGRRYALGDTFSVVDCYLLVFWIWSQRDDIRPHLQTLPAWEAVAERVFARPLTWPVLNREGISRDNIRDP